MHQARQSLHEFVVESIGLLLDPQPRGELWRYRPVVDIWPHAVVVEYTAQCLEMECLVVETFPSEDKET